MPNAPSNSASARDAALEMRRRHGWFVFPAHPREKRPYGDFRWLPYGDQLPDIEAIASWTQWDGRGCRVAVRTGAVSGIIVLDCDSEDARAFVKKMGHPPGPMAKTGREGTGLHIYFKHPGRRVKNATHFRGIDRLDVRGDGGIVLAPPSLHESGKPYEWIISPEEAELPDCPKWLLEMFDEADEGREPLDIQETFSGISEGKRDETLFRLAAKMRYHDFPVEVTMVAVEEAAKKMQPPFPAKDARAKVTWTYTNYEPGEDGAMLKVEEIIEQQAEAAEGLKTQTLSDLMKKKFPPVKWVVPGILPEGTMLFAGKPKTGKANAIDTPVLTPSGWKTMDDMQVGDEVIGANGRPTKILAVHPQGIQALYKVYVTGGDWVETTEDHLWQVQSHQNRVSGTLGTLKTTGEIKKILESGRERAAYLPTVDPIEFACTPSLPLDPYLLGALIGDGGLTTTTPAFTSPDRPVIAEMRRRLPPGSSLSRQGQIRYSIRGPGGGRPNPVTEALRKLGLSGKKSCKKFIPVCYKQASVQDRMDLIRGLVDTDGWVERTCTVYSTSSEQLAKDFKEIVETLGGVASLRCKEAGYRKKETREYVGCLPSYSVTFRLPEQLGNPFHLPRKSEEYQRVRDSKSTHRPPLRKITRVEYSRHSEAKCITVSAPDGLYVTDHCIVTHNSFFVLSLCLAVATGQRALGRFKVEQGPVLYLALEDVERRLQKRAIDALGGRVGSDLFHYTSSAGQIDTTLLGELELWLKAHPKARLVVIDTLAKVRSRKQSKNSNLYHDDYQTVEGLTALAGKYSVAIVIVTHTNQMREASDPWDMIQGSTGLTGGVNGAMVLTHGRGEAEGFLKAGHHDLEEHVDIALHREENGLWTFIGDAEKFRMTQERRQILELLDGEEMAMSPSEVAKALGKGVNAVNKLMRKMMDEGDLSQQSYGRYVPSLASPGVERLKTDPDPDDTMTF